MRNEQARPVRVVHLTGNLDRGGIETWLVNVFRNVNRSEVSMDVMVLSPHPQVGQYDDEIRALGGRVIHLPSTRHLLPFSVAFLKALREYGAYDIVHSHVHHFGGLALCLARLAGVPGRLATSHSDTLQGDLKARNARYAYLTLMRAAMQHAVTHRMAVTPEAARALFGPEWKAAGTELFMLGIDLHRLQTPRESTNLRAELQLPPGVPIWGHVGLMRPEKNQLFLLDVFSTYLKRHGEATLLLVGDGTERPAIEARLSELGLNDKVRLLGSRGDVPELLHLMDVFVLPSLFEGMGLALLEAQAVGLPCVVSTTVPLPEQVDPAALNVKQVPLSAGLEVWANTVARMLSRGRCAPPELPMDIRQRTRDLVERYRQISLEKA